MPNLNKVILCGHLSRDPEVRIFENGTHLCNVTIAVNTGPKDNRKAHFIDCKLWGKTAEYIAERAKKGNALLVEGEINQESWKTEDDKKRSKLVVNCRSAQLIANKSDLEIDHIPESDIPF